jgi:hypothetical protein
MEEVYIDKIRNAFSDYKSTVWSIDVDLHYWQSFLKWAITEYQKIDNFPEIIFEAGYFVYDIDHSSQAGWLKSNHSDSFIIKRSELDFHRQDFTNWVMNLAIVRAYNAIELFFLQLINIYFFKNQKIKLWNKKDRDKVQNQIKIFLTANNIRYDTKNNKHIVQFFRINSVNYSEFLLKTIRVDLNTNWENFFELLSILRNIIAHNAMIVTKDIQNEINSKSQDIFQRQFNLRKGPNGLYYLHPIENIFMNFISLINDFTLNSIKHVTNQKDLSFLDMN